MSDRFIEKILNMTDDTPFVKLADTAEWISYKKLWSRAYIYARFLNANAGEEVGVALENGIELFSLYFACMLSNIRIIPVDPQKSEKEIDKIFSNHKDLFVIKSCDQLPETDNIEDTIIGGSEDSIIEAVKALIERIDLDKEFMVTYTSGSTGEAKGVRHSLRNLFLSAESFGKSVVYDKNSVCCHTMPMTYMAGILNTIMMPFIWGSKIVIYPRFAVMEALSFWKRTRDNGVNSFWMSPTMLNIILTIDRSDDMKAYFKENKPTFCIGTAPLMADLKERFETKYEVKLLQSYGLSETLFLSTNMESVDLPASSVGKLLADVDIVLKEDGEILINVPWMFKGYSNDDTASYFEGDYYKTGDLGKIEDNALSITGRKKDLIIRGGMNISPRQIENCLMGKQLFNECCVASVVENGEERVICWYVANAEIEDIFSVANKAVVEEIGTNYKVDKYIFIRELPKNLNGKIDKNALRNSYHGN